MRKILAALGFALVAAGALTFPPAATPASAQSALARGGAVSVSLFYRELAPHGRWFQHPRWGWAWFPTAVGADWRPYALGQWVWTEENGWYWVSDEPFGWAVYHYGRWAYDDEYGWIWIPGSTWGPAWVAFRESDEYFGWAPLPPETLDGYGWDASYTELDASYYQPRWVFVPHRYFLARRAYAHAVPVQRNLVVIRVTRNVTRYERGRRGVFNRGFALRRVEAALGRRVAPLRVNVVSEPRRVGPDRRGRQVNVFRPAVRISRAAAPPPGARARAQDRPRVRIQREAVPPSERRARTAPAPSAPGARPSGQAPRTVRPDDRRAPELGRDRDARRAAPVRPPAARPPATRMPETATPRPRPPGVARPDQRRDQRRAREDRRTAPPAARQSPGAPALRREERAAPPVAPRAMPRPDAPRPPAAARPQRPPAYAAPPAARTAPPRVARPQGPPPRVAPGAPPRAQPVPPRAQPPAKAPPPKKKEEERPGPRR